jgi:hypothetical protein
MKKRNAPAALTGLVLMAGVAMQIHGDQGNSFLGAATWNGLRFGITELEVKQVLKSRAVRPSENEKPVDSKNFYVPWVVRSVEVDGFSGTATIFLGTTSRRLSGVRIELTPPSDMSSYALDLRLENLRDDLSKKYGRPFLQNDCVEKETMTCKTTWKDKGQTVDLIVFLGKSISLLYLPIGSTPDI